ncbi:MAG: hypothetical protein ACOC6F_02350 [bacterium]
MDLMEEIKADLVSDSVPLSRILRKARVLAYQLESEELKEWVSQELDGYRSENDLPDYRVLKTDCYGTWTNGVWRLQAHLVSQSAIESDELKEFLTTLRVFEGIRSIEERAHDDNLSLSPPGDAVRWVNRCVSTQGWRYINLRYAVDSTDFEQILDTVRNRLLEFVLELDSSWNIEEESPQGREVNELVRVFIYNNPRGGNVSIFDQRGQEVTYQYNAAGDIRVTSAQNREELVSELEKLRRELRRARESGALEEDTAVKTEYHLMEAVGAAQEECPDVQSFFEHIGKAKDLLEDAAAAVGLVTAFMTAMEVAARIFQG